jgi:ribosome-associated protein
VPLPITRHITLPDDEIVITAIRAQGAGGQNVNKTSCAIHLRFDILASSLPDEVKARLLALEDHRITQSGEVVIKAQEHRSRDLNQEAARARLAELLRRAATVPRQRKATRPTLGSKLRRLESKNRTGQLKKLRGRGRHYGPPEV